jgi:DNA-binding LacI/PurR family transcriptional regulator
LTPRPRRSDAGNPTIVDVAKAAGVSKSTVSNVLRGETRYTPETRDRVLEAIEQLGYHRNAAARYLVRQQADVLGVVVGDFANPFDAEVAALLEQEAATRGYTTLLATTSGDADIETARVQTLLQHRVGAILFLAFSGRRRALEPIPATTPVVFVSFHSSLAPSVSVDNVAGAALAVRHLLDHGHKRIGYVSTTLAADPEADAARFQGYLRALDEAGIASAPDLVVRTGRRNGKRDEPVSLEDFLGNPKRPTAVFAASDNTALEVMDTADHLGLRIPEDISLVGFDDIAVARLKRVSLTTVAVPLRDLARVSIETAIARIEGHRVRVKRLPARLVVRGSTGPPPR